MDLYRSEDDKVILGLCGGLGDKTEVSSNGLRLILALWMIGTLGLILPLYLATIFLPKKETGKTEFSISSSSKEDSESEEKDNENLWENSLFQFGITLFFLGIGGLFLLVLFVLLLILVSIL